MDGITVNIKHFSVFNHLQSNRLCKAKKYQFTVGSEIHKRKMYDNNNSKK